MLPPETGAHEAPAVAELGQQTRRVGQLGDPPAGVPRRGQLAISTRGARPAFRTPKLGGQSETQKAGGTGRPPALPPARSRDSRWPAWGPRA